MTVSVILNNTIEDDSVPAVNLFQQWVDYALSASELTLDETIAEVVINIVDAEQSATLNETFRGKKGPTNVLAFTYDPIPGIAEESLGDLAICAEIMKHEANEQEIPLTAHWAHLTIHGILHLMGYDHITESDAAIMEPLEIKALEKLGFENPYKTNG